MGRTLTIARLPGLGVLSATLARYVAELSPEELPTFLGALETAKARAWLRLVAAERAVHGQQTPADADRFLDAQAMAELLDVPKSWVEERARTGRLPSHKLGHYVRFDPVEVCRTVREQGGNEDSLLTGAGHA